MIAIYFVITSLISETGTHPRHVSEIVVGICQMGVIVMPVLFGRPSPIFTEQGKNSSFFVGMYGQLFVFTCRTDGSILIVFTRLRQPHRTRDRHALGRTPTALVQLKAKFHYAIWSQAGLKLVAASRNFAYHLARASGSATSFEPVCDQIA